MIATLAITDGTDRVDWISPHPGPCLVDYKPGHVQLKNGGYWNESSLLDGRQMVNYRFANVIDTITFSIINAKQDGAIAFSRLSDKLLLAALNYYSARFSSQVVWLERRTRGATTLEYALIKGVTFSDGSNIFTRPFTTTFIQNTLPNLTIALEHTPWSDHIPGQSTGLDIGATEAYDGRTLGNISAAGADTPASDGSTFYKNARNEANLTDIYIDDGGVFGANLMDAAVPFALLPAVPAVADAVYFGIDSTLADSGPFSNIIFKLSVAGAGYSGTWEYWNGAWVALSVQDDTSFAGTRPFGVTGDNGVWWVQPSDWATLFLVGTGITAYWVRMRVTAITVPTAPTQSTQKIYSVIWPYLEINTDQVGGDIPMIAKVDIINNSENGAAVPTQVNDVILGMRSTSRGSGFTAFLNAADEQNPSGVTTTDEGTGAFATDVTVPTGRIYSITTGGVTTMNDMVSWELNRVLSQTYIGVYRVYLRVQQTGGSVGDGLIRVGVITSTSSASRVNTRTEAIPLLSDWLAIDLGLLSIPGNDSFIDSDDLLNVKIFAQLETLAAITVKFVDLVLIPADEYLIESVSRETTDQLLNGGDLWRLSFDSITNPKRLIRTFMYNVDDEVLFTYQPIGIGPFSIQPSGTQRIWIMTINRDLNNYPTVDFAQGGSLQIGAARRYTGMAGRG